MTPAHPPLIRFSVPSETAVAAEMAASGTERMQAINRIRQREALQRALGGRR